MKKFIIVCLLISSLSSTNSFSHSGNTDSNGGHYNRRTGVYHYHHGSSAHSHHNGVCMNGVFLYSLIGAGFLWFLCKPNNSKNQNQ